MRRLWYNRNGNRRLTAYGEQRLANFQDLTIQIPVVESGLPTLEHPITKTRETYYPVSENSMPGLLAELQRTVPQALRDAAYGLGSTRSETIRQVVLPAALPGVVASILLAVSRAVGETMIVVMAAGLAANLSLNPLDAVTTVTSQIVTILVGDQEFESAKTLSAFALALTLIVITLGLNFMALQIVKKYREQYE